MAKKTQTPLGIFIESIGLYFSNFDKFIKYMTFPVLGQILGLILIFTISYFYTQNISALIDRFHIFNDFLILILFSIIITLPGLMIFMKAFWEYLIAYGAINSMYENMSKSGKVYDFDAHTELIKRRSFAFIGIWFFVGIFSIIAACPLFWVICGILAVYFVLVFQVFTFEPELNPVECFKRSIGLVKGKFLSTFLLICFTGIFTYLFIPQIIIKLFDISGISSFLSKLIVPLLSQIQDINLTQFGLGIISKTEISIIIIQSLIAQILIQYTLPMRSILWSLWYKELSKNSVISKENKSQKKKRPSEKLMEESHKKYGKKRIDRNILRRAMEKDED